MRGDCRSHVGSVFSGVPVPCTLSSLSLPRSVWVVSVDLCFVSFYAVLGSLYCVASFLLLEFVSCSCVGFSFVLSLFFFGFVVWVIR